LAYFRQYNENKILVILNFYNRKRMLDLPVGDNWKILFSTHQKKEQILGDRIIIKSYEALILEKQNYTA
jgi:hypothetical protein